MSTSADRPQAGVETERRPARSLLGGWPARLRRLRRLWATLLGVLLIAMFAAGLVRAVRMIGLPDVGDPFAAPRPPAPASTPAAPPRTDPIALYRQAIRQLSPEPSGTASASSAQAWLEANRASLRLFR